jgi:hypothetical protein
MAGLLGYTGNITLSASSGGCGYASQTAQSVMQTNGQKKGVTRFA